MVYRLATLLSALAIAGCGQIPVAVECPPYPAPPPSLAPALPDSPTPLLDSWQKSKAELLQSLKKATGN